MQIVNVLVRALLQYEYLFGTEIPHLIFVEQRSPDFDKFSAS